MINSTGEWLTRGLVKYSAVAAVAVERHTLQPTVCPTSPTFLSLGQQFLTRPPSQRTDGSWQIHTHTQFLPRKLWSARYNYDIAACLSVYVCVTVTSRCSTTRSSAVAEGPRERAVSWNLVKYCTNVRRIALEKAYNQGMTFKVIQGH